MFTFKMDAGPDWGTRWTSYSDCELSGTTGGLEIGFSTNESGDHQRGTLFSGVIPPEAFEAVAREMMEANPEAAIKAFNAVQPVIA